MISKSSRKTDRKDAHTLARIGRVDPSVLYPIWLRDERCLAVRAALRARKHLVWSRTRLINRVRAECKVHGVLLGSCTSRAFAAKAEHDIPEILRRSLLPILETLDFLSRQIDDGDKQIERIAKGESPETRVLRQVPGVGPLVALTYAVTIGDPKRFRDSRQVGAHLGLVPRGRAPCNLHERGSLLARALPRQLIPPRQTNAHAGSNGDVLRRNSETHQRALSAE